jgi:hypothetical protein
MNEYETTILLSSARRRRRRDAVGSTKLKKERGRPSSS